MAHATFKSPKAKKDSPFGKLPTFRWENLSSLQRIGHGSFGTVDSAIYCCGASPAKKVTIKQPIEAACQIQVFTKEASIFHNAKGHMNIAEFIAVSSVPPAIMQEYMEFSFSTFNDSMVVHSLDKFLSHMDNMYDFEGFKHVQNIVAADVVNGLAFLHEKNIVHRDLKPSNVLVSNQHYISLEQEVILQHWHLGTMRSVICKLTDFGESQSHVIQTRTLVSSIVENLNRGSPAYMAPEILLSEKRPGFATMEDLKSVDLWALGMLMFVVANPSIAYPYQHEIERECNIFSSKDSRKVLEDLLRAGNLPEFPQKYDKMQVQFWDLPVKVFDMCISFDRASRVSTIEPVLEDCTAAKTSMGVQCSVVNLPISQKSALEESHCLAARKFQAGSSVLPASQKQMAQEVSNDGTNSCVFLCLKICDKLMKSTYTEDTLSSNISDVTVDIINTYPFELNPHRDISKKYDILEAYTIMNTNAHIGHFDFTEELPFADGVFAKQSRTNLERKLQSLANKNSDFYSIYTCEPYSIVIRCIKRRIFAIDTHSVPEANLTLMEFAVTCVDGC